MFCLCSPCRDRRFSQPTPSTKYWRSRRGFLLEERGLGPGYCFLIGGASHTRKRFTYASNLHGGDELVASGRSDGRNPAIWPVGVHEAMTGSDLFVMLGSPPTT